VNWETIADVGSAVFFLTGALLTLASGIGVLRFPDLLARMHASTKPHVLGVLLALVGYALRLRSWYLFGALTLIALFQLLTIPVAAHMVARAGYRTGKIDIDQLVVDELTQDLEASITEIRERPEE